MCDDKTGQNQGLPVFTAGAQHTIQAIIGNSSDLLAGALFQNLPPIEVQCNAYVWNTFLSPSFALQEMSALDAPNAQFTYKQPGLVAKSYGVVGFRFDVDQVFKGLTAAMKALNLTPQQLGAPDVDSWMKGVNAHACVKVLVRANEFPDTPNGPFPDDMVAVPTSDRHIAQRNLAGFDMTLKGAKKLQWQNFMMSQAFEGANTLAIDAPVLPNDGVRYYLAVPTQMFERHVAKAGPHRGFEVVTDTASKPFPDAVILRRTTPEARLSIADHAKERFFGMALGVEWDPTVLARARTLGDISVAHHGRDGKVVGGFTLRPQVR